MKSKIFVIIAVCTAMLTVLLFSVNKETVTESKAVIVHAQYESGKWVSEYGGGSTPFRCVCVKDMLRSDCRVGDTSSNLSLCE